MNSFRRLSGNRTFLRILYYMWVVFPYPIRKPLTAAGIGGILGMKKLFRVNKNTAMMPTENLGNLSFWGVPEVNLDEYTLTVCGEVKRQLRLTFDDLMEFKTWEGPVRMDCVGGFRNNSTMKGVPLVTLFEAAGAADDAQAVAFHCADGYHTTHAIDDLLSYDAFMAYEVNGQRVPKFGFPLRLAAPGTYGYKWAKWVTRIELLSDFPKGFWEKKGLPKRGKMGDVW